MKKIKVGIPYALYFYEYYPLWEEFLSRLGVEVILSKPTNKNILDLGIRSSLSEICLPVKVFIGHVLSLTEQVDYILIPRMVCIEKGAFFCPKIIGLPDMVKASIPSVSPVISPIVDIENLCTWKIPCFQLGQYLSQNSITVSRAFSYLWDNFQKLCCTPVFLHKYLDETVHRIKKIPLGIKTQARNLLTLPLLVMITY